MRTCIFPGCTNRIFAAGLCRGHYARRQRGAPLAPLKATGPGRGRHLQAITIRLQPETLAALGPDVTVNARRILETVTGTGIDGQS